MRFIPNEKYSIVKKMAMEGNEQAKNFLGNFMEMDDTRLKLNQIEDVLFAVILF